MSVFTGMRNAVVLHVLFISGVVHGADCLTEAQRARCAQVCAGNSETQTGIQNAEQEYEKGDYAAAERLFRSEIANLARCVPGDDIALLVARNNLAATLLHVGRFREAERELTSLLPLLERRGKATPELANSLNNLGEAYFAMGQFQAALRIHERALAIRESVLPAGHEHTALSEENLGRTLYALGQNTQARAYLNRALAIWEKTPQSSGYGLLTTLLALAALDGAENRRESAEAINNRVLALARKDFGENHEAYAAVLTHIAVYYFNTGQLERADRTCRDAAVALETATGGAYDDRHVFLLETHASILEGLKGRGREAASLRKRAEAVKALKP